MSCPLCVYSVPITPSHGDPRKREAIQIYRGCDEEVWVSSEKGSELRLEEFAKDGFPPKQKQLNNKSRSPLNCSSTEGCLDPGVVRNAAKTSPSARRAPCAPHCRRSDGRRDVNEEKGKMGREERRRNRRRASCQNWDEGTFMWSHRSAAATSTKRTDVLPKRRI